MRKGVLAAAGLALLAAVSWSSAQAMPLSAPAALKGAADAIDVTGQVSCWDGCGYYYRPRYRPYWRPYYRPYYGYYRPYYRPYYGYRPYYRPYYAGYGYGYGRPWWLSGPYYGGPRPRFYVGSSVYWY
jgi:hypothetical protein